MPSDVTLHALNLSGVTRRRRKGMMPRQQAMDGFLRYSGLWAVAISRVSHAFSQPHNDARRLYSLGCQNDISFIEHLITTSAEGARHAYATDLDGDGDIDVLSASSDDDTIAWYDNDGGYPPSFTKYIIPYRAEDAAYVYAADLDGDDDIDVLSASPGDSAITWYENDGNFPPSFERYIITDAADGAASVYAADLDNDGDVDVLSASRLDDTLAWYVNDGGSPPTFQREVISTSARGAESVYAADVDNDGDVDVLSASWIDATIAWYINDGESPPNFEKKNISTSARGARSVYAVDINNDGNVDVLSASALDNTIAWYDSNGKHPPTFAPRVVTTLASGARSVYAADFDNDGAIDVVSTSDDTLAWYQSDGRFPPNFFPKFKQKTINSTIVDADSVYAVDLDGDDDLDLLVASHADNAVVWYENDCRPIELTPAYGPTEFVVLTPRPSQHAVLPSTPPISRRCANEISFTEHILTTSASGAWGVHAADLDGDGDVDVLSASSQDNTVAWYENDGGFPPSFKKIDITNLANHARGVYPADLDGDTDLDVLSASKEDNTIAWYENDGGFPPTFDRKVIDTEARGATSVYAVDLDKDGDIDVLSASEFDDTIAWYVNDGGLPPLLERRVITSFAKGAHSVYAADLDNDGDIDVLSASSIDNTIAWYVNDGRSAPSFEKRIISEVANGARSVYAADLDHDGDIDVLSANFQDDTIAWYDNDGGSPPTFMRRIITAVADGASSVYAADLDNDGFIDVISASINDNTLAWYKSDGRYPPNFFPKYERKIIEITTSDAHSVYAVDIDSDGDMDMLLASSNDNTVAWYENDCVPDEVTPSSLPTPLPTWCPDLTLQPSQHLVPSTPPGTKRCTKNISFTEHIITTSAIGAWAVYAADLDGDDDFDVLSASSDDDTIAWYQNDGRSPPSFKKIDITNLAIEAKSVYAADLDGDGDLDVLSASKDDNIIAWYENDGRIPPTFDRRVIDTSAMGATSVYAADLDHDGDIDVLSASELDDTIAWYVNNGKFPLTFDKRVISDNANRAQSVYAVDVDNDGDVDVLSASWDGTVALHINNGGSPPTFVRKVITSSAPGAHSVYAIDLDNDGDIDALSASIWDDTIIGWYENDGSSPPNFESRAVAELADGAFSVFAADLDHDGAIDVVSASDVDNALTWYKSDGKSPPKFIPNYQRGVSITRADSVYAVDIDKDGDMDVLVASSADDIVAWYENECVLADSTPRPTAKSNPPQSMQPPGSTLGPAATSNSPSMPSFQVQPTVSPDSSPQLPVRQTYATLKHHSPHLHPMSQVSVPSVASTTQPSMMEPTQPKLSTPQPSPSPSPQPASSVGHLHPQRGCLGSLSLRRSMKMMIRGDVHSGTKTIGYGA